MPGSGSQAAPDPGLGLGAGEVYPGYTQAELDRAYDQRAWAPNADEVIAWYREESARTRARVPHRYAVPWGPGEDETLDVFPAQGPAGAQGAPIHVPIHVHVHGGGWRNLSKDEESFMAPTFTAAGAACVILNFSTIPKVRIPQMMEQARRAIAWVHAHAREFGGDPARIHISGHSSGGHMAGVLMTTDWAARGLPADLVKSGLLVSGMYDMRPVMLSARSNYVKLEPGEIPQLSAILNIDRVRAPVTLAWGSLETPEFQRQPQAFAAALAAAGKPVSTLCVPGRNHFEILQDFARPDSSLSRAALDLMGLAPSTVS